VVRSAGRFDRRRPKSDGEKDLVAPAGDGLSRVGALRDLEAVKALLGGLPLSRDLATQRALEAGDASCLLDERKLQPHLALYRIAANVMDRARAVGAGDPAQSEWWHGGEITLRGIAGLRAQRPGLFERLRRQLAMLLYLEEAAQDRNPYPVRSMARRIAEVAPFSNPAGETLRVRSVPIAMVCAFYALGVGLPPDPAQPEEYPLRSLAIVPRRWLGDRLFSELDRLDFGGRKPSIARHWKSSAGADVLVSTRSMYRFAVQEGALGRHAFDVALVDVTRGGQDEERRFLRMLDRHWNGPLITFEPSRQHAGHAPVSRPARAPYDPLHLHAVPFSGALAAVKAVEQALRKFLRESEPSPERYRRIGEAGGRAAVWYPWKLLAAAIDEFGSKLAFEIDFDRLPRGVHDRDRARREYAKEIRDWLAGLAELPAGKLRDAVPPYMAQTRWSIEEAPMRAAQEHARQPYRALGSPWRTRLCAAGGRIGLREGGGAIAVPDVSSAIAALIGKLGVGVAPDEAPDRAPVRALAVVPVRSDAENLVRILRFAQPGDGRVSAAAYWPGMGDALRAGEGLPVDVIVATWAQARRWLRGGTMDGVAVDVALADTSRRIATAEVFRRNLAKNWHGPVVTLETAGQ
jgi:hypothetical protein